MHLHIERIEWIQLVELKELVHFNWNRDLDLDSRVQ